MRGEPYVYPIAEIKEMNERMLEEIIEMTSSQPEFFNALVKYEEAKQKHESERERRCAGRFLLCRRE